MERMPKGKIEAFFKQFPWLEEHGVRQKKVASVLVTRITIDVLLAQPRTSADSIERHFLADGDGNIIDLVKGETTYAISPVGFGARLNAFVNGPRLGTNPAETVEAALKRIGPSEQDKVRYVVSVYDPCPTINHVSTQIQAHKLPTGYTLHSWRKKLEEDAAHEIDGEIAEVDAAHKRPVIQVEQIRTSSRETDFYRVSLKGRDDVMPVNNKLYYVALGVFLKENAATLGYTLQEPF